VFVTDSGRVSGIEVFSVDAAGQRSPTTTTLATWEPRDNPLSPVRRLTARRDSRSIPLS